jgi:serine/threonine protein kinase
MTFYIWEIWICTKKNLLLTSGGHIKIADFGSVKRAWDTSNRSSPDEVGGPGPWDPPRARGTSYGSLGGTQGAQNNNSS